MSSGRQIPIGQVKLTNVAVVRLTKGKKKFEIACYKNKVLNWRNGVEKDLDEVLQIDRVFKNVVKGVYASNKDLVKAWGESPPNTTKIILEILNKGKEQVGGKEREVQLQNRFLDIATIVSQLCVNPKNKRPYPVKMVEKTMRQYHYNPSAASATRKGRKTTAKQQALQCIKFLQKKAPDFVERAKMKVRVGGRGGGKDEDEALKDCLEKLGAILITDDSLDGGGVAKARDRDSSSRGSGADGDLIYEFEPSLYRQVHKAAQKFGNVSLQIVTSGAPSTVSQEDVGSGVKSHVSFVASGAPPLVAARDDPMIVKAISAATDLSSCPTAAPSDERGGVGVKMKRCTKCGPGIKASEYRSHFKSEWHRYNLKALSRGKKALSKEEFDALPKEAKEAFLMS